MRSAHSQHSNDQVSGHQRPATEKDDGSGTSNMSFSNLFPPPEFPLMRTSSPRCPGAHGTLWLGLAVGLGRGQATGTAGQVCKILFGSHALRVTKTNKGKIQASGGWPWYKCIATIYI